MQTPIPGNKNPRFTLKINALYLNDINNILNAWLNSVK